MPFDGRLLSGMSVLAAAVESGSFSRAGVLLGLSPSGVSRAVTRLEERIGVRLLDRTTRALRLTAEGTRLYDSVAPHLVGIEEAASDAAGTAATVQGMLKAGVNDIFARHVLAPRLPALTALHPALTVTIVQQSDAGGLIEEGVDVAIRFGPQPTSTLSSRLLMETRVLTVAAPAYLDRCGRPAMPEMLAAHDCIQFVDPQGGRPFDWIFQRGDDTLAVDTSGTLTLSDADTMVGACLAGAGVAQVLALGTAPLLASGALVELFPDWPGETYPLYAVRPSRRLPPAKVQAFIDFCLDAAREYGGDP